MKLSGFHIVLRSLKFYRKSVLYQIIIIALLTAVITGSLLTGSSVKNSLKKSAAERLGKTGIIVSSGMRYFDCKLVQRFIDTSGMDCAGLLEISGSAVSFVSQKEALNTHIYGIGSDFFSFQGIDSIFVNPGEIVVNKKLAEQLGVKKGDELIIRFSVISDIPADAPFASEKDEEKSLVMKVGRVLNPETAGNFSLSISQILPLNIFVNLTDLKENSSGIIKINRILFKNDKSLSAEKISGILKNTLRIDDIGLRLRIIRKTGNIELVTDRIFIDQSLVNEIENKLPSAAPLITYLGNRLTGGSGSTPYSFVSALPSSVYPVISSDNGIIINRWLANDLAVSSGDSINLFWYTPDSLNKLIERNRKFVVTKIVEMSGIWADSTLMPDFPGIAGSESCSDWDAGVPIKMDMIRDKDEEYWNKYKGTPKAFINYEKGKELWGNNFGPATAVRFPEGITENEIREKLDGKLNPALTGFFVTDLAVEAVKAADESVDFGTLFLSLGFFLLLASIVLLSFAVSFYFDSKRGQVSILFALGFKSKWIERLFLLESFIIGLTGCITGAFAGYIVNILITFALNSVWKGAVQTNTLSSYFNVESVLTGFFISIIITTLFMLFKIRSFLKKLNRKEKDYHKTASPSLNFYLLAASAISTFVLLILSFITESRELAFSFGSGTMLLITCILAWRQFFLRSGVLEKKIMKERMALSRLFYSFNPSHAVTPVLFIAAGIFAVLITGINRKNFDDKMSERSSGTGGYLLWCESNIPIKEDFNSHGGRRNFGFDEDTLSSMSFTELKRLTGNDASCLNLNHISAPSLLGADPADFIKKGSFSFAKHLKLEKSESAWNYLTKKESSSTIYGIADQTVLDWGLKISVGDTLIMKAENGQPLNIIIAAGLQSSVFQGYVIISKENFSKYFPSVSGTSVLLVDGDIANTELIKNTLNDRLANYGVNIERTSDRLGSFYEVTNTYLSVFGVFGALGMITGIAGLGFVLLRNYNHRKKEFALMLACGFTFKSIRRIILHEQTIILFAGITSGSISAIIATLPTIRGSQDIPWIVLAGIILMISVSGLAAIILSVRSIKGSALIASLKKD